MRMWLAPSVLVGVLALASAQTDKPRVEFVSLSFKDAPLRDVLKALFRQVEVSYSMHPDVSYRPVTLVVDKMRFDEALRNILLQVDAIYEVEAGIYLFRPIRPSREQENMVIRAGQKAPPAPPHVYFHGVHYIQADVQLILKELFVRGQKEYRCDPALSGVITVKLQDVTFDEALGAILKQVDGAWRIENGKYVIVRVRT